MTPARAVDPLFQLIKSLEKAEKRNFKLYARRNAATEALKGVQLFDALDKMEEYNEVLLLKKNPSLKKQQLSNLKAHLYRQILLSLRVLKNDDNIDLRLHEQMDFARMLYNKGLYLQSLKILARLKESARYYHQLTYLQQALFFEKKIEALYITRSMKSRAQDLADEADTVDRQLALVSKLTNLSLLLYSWYIQHGFARNEQDEWEVQRYFEAHFPPEAQHASGFYEKLYLYQSNCWYAYIRQDFVNYYRHSQHWVDLFEREPHMVEVETVHYIKGVHNVLDAYFYLQNAAKLRASLGHFEVFAASPAAHQSDNVRIRTFLFLSTARFNSYMLEGDFAGGLKIVPEVAAQLHEYEQFLDSHRVLVFYYKIACLYFGNGQFDIAIDYLNRIIHWKTDLRNDLQCYARLLHLIAHYELGHIDLLEYLLKSVYRFMGKMDNLSVVEEEIFSFLRRSFAISARDIRPALQKLLERLRQYENNRFETRAFVYLDFISWLESKLANTPVQAVIRQKYMQRKRLLHSAVEQ